MAFKPGLLTAKTSLKTIAFIYPTKMSASVANKNLEAFPGQPLDDGGGASRAFGGATAWIVMCSWGACG